MHREIHVIYTDDKTDDFEYSTFEIDGDCFVITSALKTEETFIPIRSVRKIHCTNE
jgi:hypothetical protein